MTIEKKPLEETSEPTIPQKLPDHVVEILKRPLPAEAIGQHPTKTFLSTIKAIYVVERFNEAFGTGEWKIDNVVVEHDDATVVVGDKTKYVNPMVVVKSTFSVPKYDLVVPDIFGGNDNPDRGDAFKGAATDALTKIGSYLGVGMDVYKGKGDKTARDAAQPHVQVQSTYKPPIAPQRAEFGSTSPMPSAKGYLKATIAQINYIKSLAIQKGAPAAYIVSRFPDYPDFTKLTGGREGTASAMIAHILAYDAMKDLPTIQKEDDESIRKFNEEMGNIGKSIN